MRQVNLAFKVDGRITELNVDEGDSAYAGQVVASLDKVYFQDELRLARARRDNAKANLLLLANALRRPEVIDGVIQGSSVRLVLREKAEPSEAAALAGGGARAEAAAPRFEDAFVDLLGGAPKGESALAGAARERDRGGAAVVEADGLTKRFGDFTAVDRDRFRIGQGEIYGRSRSTAG